MFEDSTFESTGRIKTRSRRWMIAALGLNGSILVALIVIPLIYPEALQRSGPLIVMEAPRTPPEPAKPTPKPEHAVVVRAQAPDNTITAPGQIPKFIVKPENPEVFEPVSVAEIGGPSNGPIGGNSPFANHEPKPVVREAPKGPVNVSLGVMAGQLIYKVRPTYPAIAVAMRAEGTVVLQAVISKSGTIENLQVAGGPPVLQQAAIDAVKQWRYRPYQLDGQVVEVETTINVVFTLGR